MSNDLTLGDIHQDLRALIERGAHPGSIDWVLHQKIEWPGGTEAQHSDCLANHRGLGAPPEPEVSHWTPEFRIAVAVAAAVVIYVVVLVVMTTRAGA